MSSGLTAKGTPRKRKPNKPSAAQQTLDKYGIDAVIDDIAERIQLIGISRKVGVSMTALMNWINQNEERSARVHDMRRQMAKIWDEEAERGIKEAPDEFELKRAKELAHHYRWRSSKTAPREYGDKLSIGGAEDLPPVAGIDATQLSNEALRELMRVRRDPADEG